MECRICHQSITFIRGVFPGRKRKAAIAIHESEAPRVLEEVHGEYVIPHPGTQRRLRLELEAKHRRENAATDEMPDMDEGLIPLDQADQNYVPVNSRG